MNTLSQAVLVPILKLDHDTFITIVKMNSNMFEHYDALWDTRVTSQVCHSWREMMLESPSLWGRLLDLDGIGQHKGSIKWTQEVLRRSGTALLWIKRQGYVPHWHPTSRYFYEVLDANWERIERLDIRMEARVNRSWDSFYTCAPHLAELNLYEDGVEDTSIPLGKPLLDNYAPYLRRFRGQNLTFKFETPAWYGGLRYLSIAEINPADILNALRKMPFLEALRIDNLLEVNAPLNHLNQPLPIVRLLRLNNITIKQSDLVASVHLMENLIVNSRCSLQLLSTIHALIDHLKEENISAFLQPLTKFLARYLDYHGVTGITLNCGLDFFEISDTYYAEDSHCINIRISSGIWAVSRAPVYMFIILGSFLCGGLSKITHLRTQSPKISGSYTRLGLSLSLSILSSVQVLETNGSSLRQIMRVQRDQDNFYASLEDPGLLPHLKTIILVASLYTDDDDSNQTADVHDDLDSTSRYIKQFLDSRRIALMPIEVLDLTKWDPMVIPLLPYLVHQPGLRILCIHQGANNVSEHVVSGVFGTDGDLMIEDIMEARIQSKRDRRSETAQQLREELEAMKLRCNMSRKTQIVA